MIKQFVFNSIKQALKFGIFFKISLFKFKKSFFLYFKINSRMSENEEGKNQFEIMRNFKSFLFKFF